MHSLLSHTAPYTKCPATCAHVRRDLPSPEKAVWSRENQFTEPETLPKMLCILPDHSGAPLRHWSPSAPATSGLTTHTLFPNCSHAGAYNQKTFLSTPASMCHYRPVSFLIITGSKYHLLKSPPPKHGTFLSSQLWLKTNKKNYQF